jgi:hypothetical protein
LGILKRPNKALDSIFSLVIIQFIEISLYKIPNDLLTSWEAHGEKGAGQEEGP